MAIKNDSSVETVSVAVVRNAEGIDIQAMLEAAEKNFVEYQENDAATTKAVVDTVKLILNSEKPAHKALKVVTASTLAKMALGMMGTIPDAKSCEDAELRIRAYMKGQSDQFVSVGRGRLAGYWFKSRLSTEELAKLVKEKTAA